MKKNLLYSFFLIFLAIHANNMGMQTGRRIIKQPLPRKTYTPQTVIHTKTSPIPTMTHRFKQYYTQFQAWLWGPPKTQASIVSEANTIVENMKKGKSGYAQDLDLFLRNQPQENINVFLNQLIKSPEGLYLLNNYVAFMWRTYIQETIKKTGAPKKSNAVIQKISTWAKDNIVNLFLMTPFINRDFFLLPLIILPNQKLTPVIKDNLIEISKTPKGKTFFQLLEKEDPELYNSIISDAAMTSDIKNVIAAEKSGLITKE